MHCRVVLYDKRDTIQNNGYKFSFLSCLKILLDLIIYKIKLNFISLGRKNERKSILGMTFDLSWEIKIQHFVLFI